MMAIAFLGYVNNSPKWFYINISYLIFLNFICVSTRYGAKGKGKFLNNLKNTSLFLPLSQVRSSYLKKINLLYTSFCLLGVGGATSYGKRLVLRREGNTKKNNCYCPPLGRRHRQSATGKEYNKLNKKSICFINISKNRGYSQPAAPAALCLPHLKKEISLPFKGSTDRLKTIISELGLNPVYIYENLETENIKKQILNETKGLSGIYMILNKITRDYYIGSASTNRIYARFSNHIIYFRGSKIVKSAVKKYELKNFAFIVLELYPNIVTKINNKELLDLEDKYLKLLLPNYNILTEAGSSFGYKHTEIDRIKMKNIYSEARRVRIGSLNRDNSLSPETIEKLRAKALNRPPMSDVTPPLREGGQKCISHTRPIVLYNLNGTVYGKYSSILEAAKSINCGEKTIRRALKTEKRLVKKQ
jgi:group I intron endonuclease